MLHGHHQNDFCIEMGSNKSHFHVSLTVRDKVTSLCVQTTTFEKKGELTQRMELTSSAISTAGCTDSAMCQCVLRQVQQDIPTVLCVSVYGDTGGTNSDRCLCIL